MVNIVIAFAIHNTYMLVAKEKPQKEQEVGLFCFLKCYNRLYPVLHSLSLLLSTQVFAVAHKAVDVI